MSIFEAKDYWSTSIGNEEEFDSSGIVIGNIDNDSIPRNKIAVSSFQGFLRIYDPEFGDYKIENLLFEKKYQDPIIQIGLGSLVINSPDKQLLLLYAKRLAVIQFYNLKGVASTKLCYEHKLPRTCFNFCFGKIGEKNYDILFVQSVDGVISIIEQDSIVNSVELYEMILPGCMVYVDRKDYLVISNPGYEIECYSYNNLATSKGKSNDNKIFHNWVVMIGELVKDIKVVDNSISKKQEIYVMSETMVHLLSDNGQILFQKKLDFEAIAMKIYNVEDPKYQPNKQINLMQMLSTHQNHIMVYKGPYLSWSLK